MPQPVLRLGISSCLLGEPTRYDGRSKPEPYVIDVLARTAGIALTGVCPETETGMPVPREPVDLVGDPAAPRMLGVTSRRDWTAPLRAWAEQRVAELAAAGLDGFILKSRSPSCGVGSTPVYPALGDAPETAATASGLFVLVLQAILPDLPLIDEQRLRDPSSRTAFLERVRGYHRRRTAP